MIAVNKLTQQANCMLDYGQTTQFRQLLQFSADDVLYFVCILFCAYREPTYPSNDDDDYDDDDHHIWYLTECLILPWML